MQEILDQIPIRHDLFSMFMFSGLLQGLFLSLVIAFRSTKDNQPIRWIGWLLFVLSIIGVDIYLCYTGLMKYAIWANDSTEVLVLLIGPIIYFFLWSLLNKEKVSFKSHWLHGVLPFSYLLLQLVLFVQPDAIKLNSYLAAYYPELPFVDVYYSDLIQWTFTIRDQWRFILLFSFLFYAFLSIRLILQRKELFRNPYFLEIRMDKYGFSKNTAWLLAIAFLIIFIVFLNFENDHGDHYIATFFTICIYSIGLFMLAESRFFEKSWIGDKYDTSGLKGDANKIVQQASAYIQEHNYYLRKDGSLKDLASQLGLAPNYLSQAINKETGQNFNDFINKYRIEEAKKRLVDDEYSHLTIAGIGQTVGFNSKSTFYTAFKKYAKSTPSAYLKATKSERLEVK